MRFAASWRRRGTSDVVQRKTGLKLDTYFSGSKAQVAARRAAGHCASKLASGDALVGTIDTYLIYRLTGGEVFATDPTNASRTLLYDIGRLRWDEELCALFDVPMRALAEVRESFAQFGETDAGGRSAAKAADLRRHGRFAGVAVCPALLRARHGQGDVRLRHVGDAERRRQVRSRPSKAPSPRSPGFARAGRPTPSKASSTTRRPRSPGSRISSG